MLLLLPSLALLAALTALLWAGVRANRLRAEAATAADRQRASASEEAMGLRATAARQLAEDTQRGILARRQRREIDSRERREREAALRAQNQDLVTSEQSDALIAEDLAERDATLQARAEHLADRQKQLDRLEGTLLGRLAERAGTSPRAVIHELGGHLQSQAALRAQRHAKVILERTGHDQLALARRQLSIVCGRYDGVGHLERVQNTFAIGESASLKDLLDPDSPSRRALAELITCELVPDPEQGTLGVRGEDPLAREQARRLLKRIGEDEPAASPARLASLARLIRVEVEREVAAAGEEAFAILDLGDAHPEVKELVGRLKFRLSYSQNQWKHAIEVATFASMLADELGVDAKLARRGGLLHDIGKAMTHDHDGSHAVLGAEVARRCGEPEIVANAIGSHHNDEPAATPIAEIVAAADAVSGARPGARRESVTSYLERTRAIQEIARRSSLVSRVDIMHAGREVRVHVIDDERGSEGGGEGPYVSDAELYPLAQEIARSIEDEVTYAGQVRVTVIRESRSVSVAR